MKSDRFEPVEFSVRHVLHLELFSQERHNRPGRRTRTRRGKVMKFLKTFLSLYSIQLIVISTLAITYLAVTATDGVERENTSAPISEASVADVESLNEGNSVKPIATQPIDTGMISLAHSGSQTPLARQIIGTTDAEIVIQSLGNERGSTSDRLLPDHRPAALNR